MKKTVINYIIGMLMLCFFCLLMAAAVKSANSAEFDLSEVSTDLPYYIVVDEKQVNVECREGVKYAKVVDNVVVIDCEEKDEKK